MRAFDAADMVEIGDDLFADDAGDRRDHHGVAGRHFEHLAGEFAPVGQHVAAEHRNLHALEARHLRVGARPARELRCGEVLSVSIGPASLKLTRSNANQFWLTECEDAAPESPRNPAIY